MGNRYKLSEVVAEAKSEHPPIEIETDDGQVFLLDPPEFWSDAAMNKDLGPVETMRLVMGNQDYDRFVKAGGSASILGLIIERETKGKTVGESAASSNSLASSAGPSSTTSSDSGSISEESVQIV